MTEDDFNKILQMTDSECADFLEKVMIWVGGLRANGKTVFKAAYAVALIRAINKLRQPEVVYLCKYHKEPHYCKHTHRIEDALNFEEIAPEKWMEKERLQGEWRERMKEHFREASEHGGNMFNLSEIERILDGEAI